MRLTSARSRPFVFLPFFTASPFAILVLNSHPFRFGNPNKTERKSTFSYSGRDRFVFEIEKIHSNEEKKNKIRENRENESAYAFLGGFASAISCLSCSAFVLGPSPFAAAVRRQLCLACNRKQSPQTRRSERSEKQNDKSEENYTIRNAVRK